MTDRTHGGVVPAGLAHIHRFLNSATGVGTVILVMALGIFVWQPWGWFIAALLLWLAPRWSVKSKWIATAIVPGAFLLVYLLTSPFVGLSVGYAAFIIFPAPIISAWYLWRRALPARSRINS